jgi:hypothetical protein
MARDKSIEAEFKYEKGKIDDIDVIYVTDKGRNVCIIHPESGSISFTFRGTLTGHRDGMTFYSLEEIKLITDMVMKITKEYDSYKNKLEKLLK